MFTVPHELNVLALENPCLFYDLLFTASAQTLLEIAIDPKPVSYTHLDVYKRQVQAFVLSCPIL